MRTAARFLPLALGIALFAHAETGYEAWLRYAPLEDGAAQRYVDLPAVAVALDDSVVVRSAQDELIRGLRGMLGRTLRIEISLPPERAIVLGTFDALKLANVAIPADLPPDSYWMKTVDIGGLSHLVIAAPNGQGVLYGAFALLRKIGLSQSVDPIDEKQIPYAPVRWVNEWNNLNGTIERGYGGRSIFFENNDVRADLSRARDYARMLASLGINGCAVNNVNANPRVITAEFLPRLARLAEAFRPWGVRMAISVDFGSPKSVGALDTFDPANAAVLEWWRDRADEIYRAIPDLAGFVLKADSEGRVGPSVYGRTHADAANALARALRPHGGLLFYRGFVYDHHMDWRNLKNDRARAAYDNFHDLDGKFDDNVIIQIKHGPIDFQVREPASPLFGALEKTNQAVELQITQEYMGQQRHLCFLVPMWKEALDFDLQAKSAGTPVKALVAGKVFGRPAGGFVGVSNIGINPNWLGHQLAQANLYGFGRLAWNPDLSPAEIIDEWTRLTYGHDPLAVNTIADMQLRSWNIYENYTGPLGAGTLTEITGNHYGPGVESSEGNGWGQWHRADEKGIGMDRTVATGTGFVGQYRPAVAKLYESLETCPDELLLFMRHVPYAHRLRSGKTVIQHIYYSHYEGAEAAQRLVSQWRTLRGHIDEQRYAEVESRLEYQAGHARVWRDAVNNWFLRKSGIPDAAGRAGRFPNRIEAESMTLDGYQAVDVTPWGAASDGKAVQCMAERCSADLTYDGAPGWFDLRVQYFDQNNGEARFKLYIGNQLVEQWTAANDIPTPKIDAHSSSGRVVTGIALRTGDQIRIEGMPDSAERAALDYIEIEGSGPVSRRTSPAKCK